MVQCVFLIYIIINCQRVMNYSYQFFNLSQQEAQSLYPQVPPLPQSQSLLETEESSKIPVMKKKAIAKKSKLTLKKPINRNQRNAIPNLNKKIFDKLIKSTMLFSRLSVLEDVIVQTKKGKDTMKIAVTKKCCKTQLMKLLKLLRNEFSLQIQRKEINTILQKCVDESIRFQQRNLSLKPKEKAEIQKPLKLYKKIKQLIEFFLFADFETYSLKVREIRQDIFNPAEIAALYNPGVKKIQSEKMLENEMEIGNELTNQSPFNVLNLSGAQKYFRCL